MNDLLKQMVSSMTPTIYDNLKRSIEIGRWPDGRPLTDQQKEDTLQAIIAYETLKVNEQERTGYLPVKDCSSAPDDTAPLQWKNDTHD